MIDSCNCKVVLVSSFDSFGDVWNKVGCFVVIIVREFVVSSFRCGRRIFIVYDGFDIVDVVIVGISWLRDCMYLEVVSYISLISCNNDIVMLIYMSKS